MLKWIFRSIQTAKNVDPYKYVSVKYAETLYGREVNNMKNEKLLFAAVAIIGWALSHALSGVKLPSGYDVGTVLAWVAGIGGLGFAIQFIDGAKFTSLDNGRNDSDAISIYSQSIENWHRDDMFKENNDKFLSPVWEDLPQNIHHKSMFD